MASPRLPDETLTQSYDYPYTYTSLGRGVYEARHVTDFRLLNQAYKIRMHKETHDFGDAYGSVMPDSET